MATKNIVPRGNNEGQLGTDEKRWNSIIAETASFTTFSGSITGAEFTLFSGSADSTASFGHLAGDGGGLTNLTATAEPAEGGQVVPEFMEYGEGDSAYVVATPSDEYVLESWSGDASGNANTIVLAMDKNKEVTANFIKKKYQLTPQQEKELTTL